MKVFLLVVLIGIAAARSVQDAGDAGKLYKAVGLPECASELNAVEKDMKTELGKALRDILHKITNRVGKAVNDTKEIAGHVKDKIKALKDKLSELGEESKVKSQEAIDLVRKTVHDIVDTILDKIQKKKENLDKHMDEVSKLKIEDLIKELRERIAKKVQAIREYIKSIAVDNEAVRELKALLDKINDDQMTEILNNIFDLSGAEVRHVKELLGKLEAIGVKTKGVLKEKILDLTGWVRDVWHDGLEELVEKFRKVKSTLTEVISNAKDFSVEAARETLKQLELYKDHMGELYGKLVESLKKAIGKF